MFGSKGVLTFFADYSNRREVDYQDDNKVWVQKLGYNWDNFGNWGQAVQAAYACDGLANYPSPVDQLSADEDPCDAGYYGGSGLRKDFLTYLSYKTALSSHLTWKTTLYGHRNDGRGLWFTPYSPTYDATGTPVSPISLRTSEYGISRGGVVSSLTLQAGRDVVEGGVWFREEESFDLARRFYGTSVADPLHSLYAFPSNPFYTQWAYNFPTTVYQLHLQDEYKVNSQLTLSAGFKSSETNTTGNLTGYDTGVISLGVPVSSFAQGSLGSGKPFLPQVGVNYKLGRGNEVFADVAENVRAFQAGGKGFGTSPWGTTQMGFDTLTKNLKSESSWSEEVGYRHVDNHLEAQANYFHVNFSNRLLAITQGAGIAGNASILSNVGGVTTNGVDGAVTYRTRSGWSLYNAITLNKSGHNSHDTIYGAATKAYPNGVPTVIPTGGKVTVDSPEVLYKNEL